MSNSEHDENVVLGGGEAGKSIGETAQYRAPTSEPVSLDALLPAEMAKRAEEIGARKTCMPVLPLLGLAVLAGAFVALGPSFPPR